MSTDPEWKIQPGEHLTRAQRRALFGGAVYGGIQPSKTTPNIFIYSDPAAGGLIYPYDGWAESDAVFLYTGEGRLGDQEMRGGNAALLRHEGAGRAVRLFIADGVIEGTAEKNHLYVGEFRVDTDDPFRIAPAPDDNGEDRNVIVFRLLRVGAALVRSEDASRTGADSSASEVALIPPEAHNAPSYETAGSEGGTAKRRESDLVRRYRAYLEGQGHAVKRWRIRPPGELLPLLTDIYDETAHELYEAKGSAVRNSVRLAIGQLSDYRRYLTATGLQLTLLLPSRPSDDLLSFIGSVGMGCVYEEGGTFNRIERPESPPSVE